MDRPAQHVTDSLGQTQLRALLEPYGWTVNRVEHDYGVDFDVEVFRDHKSTGISFKIQLKSSESTPYSTAGDFISQPISINNARYLCRELRSPVILVHADVKSGRTFWVAPQLEVESIKKLSEGIRSDSIVLRIPTKNEIPATILELVQCVARVETVLATRAVVSSGVPDFISSIKGHVLRESVIRSFRDKADALRIEQAQEMLRNGEGDKALPGVEAVIGDPSSSIEMKFSALLMKERIRTVGLTRGGTPQPEVARLKLATAVELQRLVKGGPRYLKFYALIAEKAAELDILVHRDWGLFLNWKVSEKRGDPFWIATLVFERAALIRRIAAKYNQCIRLAQYAANSRHRWALPEALLRIVTAVGVFILRLKLEGLIVPAERYSASALQICKLAVWLANESSAEEHLPLAVSMALMITEAKSNEVLDWARDTVRGIKNDYIKQTGEFLLDRHVRRLRGETFENDIETTDRQIVENMAMAIGIDLSSPDDPGAKWVELGIKDADPGRVLKNCEHIFLTLGARPPLAPTTILANVLGLPTIGSKILHCDLHRYHVTGLGLDSVYANFKKRFCDGCRDCAPRPPDWKYSDEWQARENLRHLKFMEEFLGRMGGRA